MKYVDKGPIFDYSYQVLKTFALTHNYNQWIINLMIPYIKGEVLEVGCGIGNLTAYLSKICKLTCIDISPNYVCHLQIDFPEVEIYLCDISDEKSLLSLNKKFTTIVSVNVLEHIKDDIAALKNMYNLLVKNGNLILYVPAIPWIYGSMDVELQHWRRYDKKTLKEKLELIGFQVEKIEYTNFLGFIGWFLNGKILRRKKFSILQPLIFDKFIPFIAKIEHVIKPSIGMSLFIVAKKI